MSDRIVAVNRQCASPLLLAYAADFDLAVVDEPAAAGFVFQLYCDGEGRVALSPCDNRKGGPLYIDFADGGRHYRRKQAGIRQPLMRAVGCKPGFRPNVLDATAGLAMDAFLLAAVGCQVAMLEQHPVVYTLLADAVQRGRQLPGDAGQLVKNMVLPARQNAIEYLIANTGLYDAVYLDPMFAEKQFSAKVKKGMQYLQAVVGTEPHQEVDLLHYARKAALRRVVVKRARSAPVLAGCEPDHQLGGKTIRYDVYLKT